MGKLNAKISNNLPHRFGINRQYVSKWQKRDQFRPFWPWKMTFRVNPINFIFAQWFSTISLGRFLPKYKKVTNEFLRKLSNKTKIQNVDPFLPSKTTLRAIQPNSPYDMLFMSYQRRKKLTEISTPTAHTPMTWCTHLQSFEKIRLCIFELQCKNF